MKYFMCNKMAVKYRLASVCVYVKGLSACMCRVSVRPLLGRCVSSAWHPRTTPLSPAHACQREREVIYRTCYIHVCVFLLVVLDYMYVCVYSSLTDTDSLSFSPSPSLSLSPSTSVINTCPWLVASGC